MVSFFTSERVYDVRRYLITLCVLCLVPCLTGFASAGPSGLYYVTNVGNIGGDPSSIGMSLATVGSQLVVAVASDETAYVWTQAGGIVNLQTRSSCVRQCLHLLRHGCQLGGTGHRILLRHRFQQSRLLYNFNNNTISNLDSWCLERSGSSANINTSGVFGGTYTVGTMPEQNGYYANTQTSTFTGVGAHGDPYGTTNVSAINNNGWLAGYGLTTSGTVSTQLVEWQGSGTGWVMLPTWAGNTSGDACYAEGMDGAGDVVGYTLGPGTTRSTTTARSTRRWCCRLRPAKPAARPSASTTMAWWWATRTAPRSPNPLPEGPRARCSF